MRQSQLLSKTSKQLPKDETSSNAQLLLRAGYIDKLAAGVYSLLPLGVRVVQKITAVIRQSLNGLGAQELLLPSLQPAELWQTTGRWDTMHDILYKLQDAAQRWYTLGPTHEEVVVPLVQKHVMSYKDLPVSVYQFQTKFRMELRPKSGILRGREFIMKDMYSFHADQSDLEHYYQQVKQVYFSIFEQLGIGSQTYFTFASGGAFSKYSHEFQTVTPAGEDSIFICQKCHLAINREIITDASSCPECGQTEFREARAIEVGNIFILKDKYTKPFQFQYRAKDGTTAPVLMGCYGMGISRLLGTIVEVHHDERGIIWSENVSPFRVHLLNLNTSSVQADEIYQALQKQSIEVLYDDRSVSAGTKFSDADLLGIPHRLVLSPKTGQHLEYKSRTNSEVTLLSLNQFIQQHV